MKLQWLGLTASALADQPVFSSPARLKVKRGPSRSFPDREKQSISEPDYRKQHLRDAGEPVELVLDLVGGESRRETFDAVRKGAGS